MQQIVSEYLDNACKGIRDRERQRAVRAELAGHFADVIAQEMKDGQTEEAAAMRAVARMGDVEEVSLKLAEANRFANDKKCRRWGAVMVCFFVLLGILWCANFSDYFDESSIIMITALTAGITLLGGREGLDRKEALRRIRYAALYAGGITFVMTWIAVFAHAPLENYPICASVSLIDLFYALIVSGVAHGMYSARGMQKNAHEVLGLETPEDAQPVQGVKA